MNRIYQAVAFVIVLVVLVWVAKEVGMIS